MFDAHIHLQDSRFANRASTAWAEAGLAGVTGAVCCGTHPADWRQVVGLTALPGILPALGLHPWYIAGSPAEWPERLDQMLSDTPNAFVGEAGLDGLCRDPLPEIQIKHLKNQIEMAVRYSRPIILHGVRAWGKLLEILKAESARLPAVMLHGCSASPEMIPEFSRLGCFFSFSGLVTRQKARKTRESARKVPLDRLLIETDSPDMFPEKGMAFGRSADDRPLNQPANLPLVAAAVAELRGITVRELDEATTRNFERFRGALNE